MLCVSLRVHSTNPYIKKPKQKATDIIWLPLRWLLGVLVAARQTYWLRDWLNVSACHAAARLAPSLNLSRSTLETGRTVFNAIEMPE